MQLFNDFIQYLDTHRHCFLFCYPQENLPELYDTFKYHENTYFKAYKITLWVIGGLTNIIVPITIFILLNYGKNLAKTYRNMMAFNTFLPALLTNHICFIAQPYAIGPNFIIYSLGPFTSTPYWTLVLMGIVVLIAAPLTFLLFSQLSYHAFIIIKPQSALKMFWINLTWYSTAICSLGFNMIMLFLAIDRQHYRLENEILEVDPRFRYILDKYAPYIINMNTATIPMNILLGEAIYAIVFCTILLAWAAYRILRSYCKNRTLLSVRLTTAQRNIIYTLLIYGITYHALLGFPSVAAGFVMLLGAPISHFPFAALYFTSSSIVAIVFCGINLATVTPYRRALRQFLFKWFPNFVRSISTSATISENHAAVAPAAIAVSLFTGERARLQAQNPRN